MNENEEQKKFLEILKELAETQAIIAKIDAQLAIRQGKEQIDTVISQTKETLRMQAEKLGANISKIEQDYLNENSEKKTIISEYREVLEEVNEVYDMKFQEILEKKAQLEQDEQECMLDQKQSKINTRILKKDNDQKKKILQSEINKALKEENYEFAHEKINELQELIEDNSLVELQARTQGLQARREEIRKEIENCEKEYENALEDRKSEIKALTDEKNNLLAKTQKQNIFQKMAGALFNRFNGTKKFVNTSIATLQSKVTNIKDEKIPQIKETVSGKCSEFAENINNSRIAIEETVQSRVQAFRQKMAEKKQETLEKISNLKESINERANELGQNIVETKDAVVDKASDIKDAVVGGVINVKDNITTHVTGAISKGKQTYRGVVQKGYEAKMNLINAAKKKLEEQQVQIAEKMQILAQKDNEDKKEER